MSNKYFYVHNGLTVGELNVDAATGNLKTSGVLSSTNVTVASSTVTGALIVAGGVGVGGNLYATGVYSGGAAVWTTATLTNNNQLINGAGYLTAATIGDYGVSSINGTTYIGVSSNTGSVTITNLGVQTITAGTDTAVSASTGTVTVWNNSTFQSVTNRGASTTNALSINNDTAGSSTSSGQALLVTGGIGALKVVATEVYDGGNRVLTNVAPAAGTGISVTSVSTSGGTVSFTVNNTGVTSLSGTAALGVSGSTGAVTLTNLGVTSAVGTTYLGVSASTGSVTFTNLGVQSLAGSTYLGVSDSTGTVTITNLGVQTITAGTDTAVSASTGTVTVWNNSTLQSVTDRGATTNNSIHITNTTQSSTSTDGALIVDGGLGVGKNVNIGGTLNVWGAATFSSPVTFNGTATYVFSTNTVYTDNIIELHTTSTGVGGSWTFDDGKDIGLRFHYYNRSDSTDTNAALVLANDSQWLEWYGSGAESNTGTFLGATYGVFKTGAVRLVGGVDSSNTTTGDLTVLGGIGVGGNGYFGGTVYSNGVALSNFSTATLVSQALTANNIAGGLAGFIPIQSAAGVTSFIGTGTSGYVLKMGVNTATWVDINTLITISSTATNLAGGTTGAIPYQTSAGLTEFIGIGAAGTVLQSNGTTATYVTTASLVVGTALTATNAAVAYSTVAGLTAGSGLTGSTFNGSTAVTWTLNTATLMAQAVSANTAGSADFATTATNVAGGTVNATTVQASGVSTFSNTVIVANSPVVYDQTGTSVGITPVTVDSFAAASYRSAKYVVTVSNSGNTAFQSTEVLIIHDGTTPYLHNTSVFTGETPIMTFTTTISGGNVLLQATGTATGNTVKVQRIYTTV